MISEELIRKYVTFRNYFNKGSGEINWIKNIGKDFVYLLAALFLIGSYGEKLWVQVGAVLFFVLYLVVCFVIGFWWDKRRFFVIENDWGTARSSLRHLMKNDRKSKLRGRDGE